MFERALFDHRDGRAGRFSALPLNEPDLRQTQYNACDHPMLKWKLRGIGTFTNSCKSLEYRCISTDMHIVAAAEYQNFTVFSGEG
jgi:hypothetical protein